MKSYKQVRREYIVDIIIQQIICLIAGMLFFYMGYLEEGLMLGIAFLAFGYGMAMWLCFKFWSMEKKKTYESYYHFFVIMEAYEENVPVFDEIKINPFGGMPDFYIKECGFLSDCSYYMDTYLYGKYHGVNFRQVEMNGRADGKRHEKIRGTLMVFDTVQELSDTLIMNRKADQSVVLPQFQETKIIDKVFGKMFAVYASGMMASSEYMNKIYHIQSKISGKIIIQAIDHRVYVFISDEGSPMRAHLNMSEISKAQVREYINRITYFIDELA